MVAAGALGTNSLLRELPPPRLAAATSPTGSATWSGPTASRSTPSPRPSDERDFAKSVAISSSIYPDPDTHVEVVTYGRNADSMSLLFTLLTGRGTTPDAAVRAGSAR